MLGIFLFFLHPSTTYGCRPNVGLCVCVNLPSTWEQGVTPTFRLQGAIQPCYQGMANEEPDSKVLQRTCKGTETISPLCQGQNPWTEPNPYYSAH